MVGRGVPSTLKSTDTMSVSSWRSRGQRVLFWPPWAALWAGGLYGYVVGIRVLSVNLHLDAYLERLRRISAYADADKVVTVLTREPHAVM